MQAVSFCIAILHVLYNRLYCIFAIPYHHHHHHGKKKPRSFFDYRSQMVKQGQSGFSFLLLNVHSLSHRKKKSDPNFPRLLWTISLVFYDHWNNHQATRLADWLQERKREQDVCAFEFEWSGKKPKLVKLHCIRWPEKGWNWQ